MSRVQFYSRFHFFLPQEEKRVKFLLTGESRMARSKRGRNGHNILPLYSLVGSRLPGTSSSQLGLGTLWVFVLIYQFSLTQALPEATNLVPVCVVSVLH